MALVAWYPFNGNSNDYSINQNHAIGSVTVGSGGKIGRTYNFNNSYFTIDNPIKSNRFSVSTWVKYNNTGANECIFCARSVVGSGISLFKLGSNFRFDAGGQWTINYTVPNNEWIHVTFIKDGNRKMFYLNGEFHSETSCLDTEDNYTKGTIGASQINSVDNYGNYLIGSLNDLRFYDHILSVKEIKEIYKTKILHYNFNECQEYTQNLHPKLTVTNSTPGNISPGWDKNLHTKSITVNYWSNGYNGGVPSPATGYHAHWIYDYDNKPIMYFPNLNNSNDLTLGNRWLGMSGNFNNILRQPGKTFTVSWYQKTTNIGLYSSGGPYYRLTGETSNRFVNGQHSSKNTLVNTWQRMSYTFTMDANLDTTGSVSIYFYGNNGSQGELYIKDIQFEEKGHNSKFVEDIRDNKITDCSGFRNHSDNMTLSTSPQWVEDSAIGSGSYKFYNNNHIIRCLQNSNPTDTLALSAWIKISQLPTENGSIITKDANYYMAIDSTGKLTTYWYGKSSPGYHTTTQTIPLNTWTHVCVSWGKSLLKMYINGTKVKEVSISGTGKDSNSYIEIGKEKGHRSFSGNIDDVRVYATDLKDIDVMELYNTRASVSKNGKLFTNEIVEKENFFNLKDILDMQKYLGLHTVTKFVKKDNKNCIAISAASFYSNSTFHSIIHKDRFKENTQYVFDILINTNLIYKGNEVPGGFEIKYTDGTSDSSLTVKTSGKWKRYIVTSLPNKTIEKLVVYYYIGDLFYCDLDNSFIYELEQSKINKKGQNITREIYENNYKPSLVDYSTWTLTSATGWGNNGTTDENCRLVYPNPKGHLDMMWATLSNDSSSGPDGGFNGPQVDIDPSKKYRFSIWIRRENVGTGSGTTYLGCNGYNSSGTNIGVVSLNGTANTNPYFTSFDHTATFGTSCTDNWILLVGYVHPYTYSPTTSDSTNGAYKMDGTRIGGISDFKWNNECGKTSIRSYLYYSTKTDEIQYFYRPRIDLCDGTEPTIQELLTCNEHLPLVDDNGQYYPNGIFSFNKDNITFSTEFIEN